MIDLSIIIPYLNLSIQQWSRYSVQLTFHLSTFFSDSTFSPSSQSTSTNAPKRPKGNIMFFLSLHIQMMKSCSLDPPYPMFLQIISCIYFVFRAGGVLERKNWNSLLKIWPCIVFSAWIMRNCKTEWRRSGAKRLFGKKWEDMWRSKTSEPFLLLMNMVSRDILTIKLFIALSKNAKH